MLIDKLKPYSIALFELAKEANSIEMINNELIFISDCISDEYLNILQSNFLDKESRHKLISESFSKQISTMLINFLMFLIDQNKIYQLKHITDYYHYLYNEYSGIKIAHVYSVELLNSIKLKKIEIFLFKKFKCKFIIKNFIDKNLIGGFKVKIEDDVLDYSLQNNLNKLKKTFMEVNYGK